MADNENRADPPEAHERPAPGLRATTGYLLSWVARDATARFHAALEHAGLTPHQYGVLSMLRVEAHKQARLSDALAVHPPQMVGHINELSERGWVERRPHPTDRRAVEVHLLPAGAAELAVADHAVEKATDEIFGALDDAERAQLHDLLTKMSHRDPTPGAPA